MGLEFIEFNGQKYPSHESVWGAALWIHALAKFYCKGENGLDIGYSKPEWKLPEAYGVEPTVDPEYHAMNLPFHRFGWDYIFSSHCLEHVKENWYNVLDYWLSAIKVGGILFLYLPHSTQLYWRPENNRKHLYFFSGIEIETYLTKLGHKVFVGGCDANHSFVVICEKVAVKTGEQLTKEYHETPIKFSPVTPKSFNSPHKWVDLDTLPGDTLLKDAR